MGDDRKIEVLADGVRLEALDRTTHRVDRTVTLSAPDPECDDFSGRTIEVTVGGSSSSYEPQPARPSVRFSVMPSCSRRQWELVKRLGDQAWSEYEERFPRG